MFFEVGTAVGGLALGALADALGKRAGFAAAVGLCVVGAWVLRTVVIPASSRDRRRTDAGRRPARRRQHRPALSRPVRVTRRFGSSLSDFR